MERTVSAIMLTMPSPAQPFLQQSILKITAARCLAWRPSNRLLFCPGLCAVSSCVDSPPPPPFRPRNTYGGVCRKQV